MPSVVIQSVESYSSEDTNFPASNLLAKDARKWRCKDSGEKSAYVILRLEKALCISGIDIGNEHSAFIEVLVAKSGPSNPEFTEILLTSSFMTPIESRNSTSVNRVRCFTQNELVEQIAREKWDLVKIICTQPFNSRVQYGIAFIKLHTSSIDTVRREKSLVPEKFQKQIESAVPKSDTPKVLKLGRFTIREESPDSDGGSTSSTNLFARWKESRVGSSPVPMAEKKNATPTLSTAAAIRNASTPAALKNTSAYLVKKPVTVTHKAKPLLYDDDDDEEEGLPKLLNRNRDSLLYDKEDDKPNPKLEKRLMEERSRQEREKLAKESKEQRDRLIAEKKEKLHDTSSSKFKDFLVDKPACSISSPETSSRPSKQSSTPNKTDNQRTVPKSVHERNNSKEDRMHDGEEKERKKRSSDTFIGSSKGEDRSGVKRPRRQQSDTENEYDKTESKKRNPTYKPFNKLLENVVLVISGIQNPDRANLRSQALAMGAKYKSDWDSSGTHLICAFKNTPKYNQVHGQGKIVKKEWIERCFALRKRISWRKFALDSDDAQQSDSEAEIVDAARKPAESSRENKSPGKSPRRSQENRKSVMETDEEVLAHYDLDDVVMVEEKPETHVISGSDTEEEIERVKQKQRERTDGNKMYDRSTEDEDKNTIGETCSTLDFFHKKIFFIDDGVGAVDAIKLKRYVELYKGTITDNANKAHYVITRDKKPMAESFRGELVKPLWVYECHDMECLIPVQRYQL
ncbi:DNA repair protein XRCC1 [Sabethes cyaneus]|uniref:DNA repair protein XRCC1 n=1 Tax=Sabethes cyaneus TaxID=53552 RepID=UPI00237E2FC6|nr:DNA repair protein XRCC1 [Sabethes cyaneus]